MAMNIPLPKTIADVGPGGGILNALNGITGAADAYHKERYNKVKADYANTSIPAQAYSQLAYANAVGPQFMAKLLGNDAALANLGDKKAKAALDAVFKAGTAPNVFSGIGQPSTNNFSGGIKNALNKIFGGANRSNVAPVQAQNNNQNALTQPAQQNQPITGRVQPSIGQQVYGEGSGDPEADAAYSAWLKTPGAQEELKKGSEADIPTPEQLKSWYRNQQEANQGKTEPEGDYSSKYATKTGKYKAAVKRLEEGGKNQAEALKDVGKAQLGLSGSGTVLNRLTDIVKNPIFQKMRSRIPFFQDKQLGWLKNHGTKEEQDLIGDYIGTAQSFIAATVQGFAGKPLVREFNLAERQKINDSDNVNTMEGKLRSASALKSIAEKKNTIIKNLLKQGIDEADAVEQANKQVDVSKIERDTDELLKKRVQITNNKTGETRTVTEDEARKLGVPNV